MKEEEIRPQQIFDEFLRLAERDTKKYFSRGNQQAVSCPSCGTEGKPSLTKRSFVYAELSIYQRWLLTNFYNSGN